ncbi:DUF1844 domain-containing protein [Desulfotalea psychrophila]|uniref:DUF1844 domain-containing protein n=1 Tax=Desulfotalea psychrophila (strain LSv54 / DSM 12343) TaxID=177439 RepID=Q6AJL5_DESPS|nr:DUF1844 domain-containing protein [Desulfotalea psychrophila]CAG37465.1 hypothetical protein DP2736 [Desulfotalea psychrophila LSv54]
MMSEQKKACGSAEATGGRCNGNGNGYCKMPEVTFSAFIMSLNTSVLYHLGEIPDPNTKQKNIDKELARHTIDTLVLLEEKTKGNLTEEEAEMLGEIVYDVKMRYVRSMK